MPSKPSLPLQRKSTFSLLKSSCAPKSRDFSTPAAFRINSAGFRQNYWQKKRPHRKNPVRPFLGEKETNRKSYPPNRSISWREPAGEHSTVISSVSPIFIPKNTCSCMAFLGSMGCQLCSGESHGSLPQGKTRPARPVFPADALKCCRHQWIKPSLDVLRSKTRCVDKSIG